MFQLHEIIVTIYIAGAICTYIVVIIKMNQWYPNESLVTRIIATLLLSIAWFYIVGGYCLTLLLYSIKDRNDKH